jgi:tetratricopeptide (TPR) repeat protein
MKIFYVVALILFYNTSIASNAGDTLTISRSLKIAESLASGNPDSALSLTSNAYARALHLENDTLVVKALKITGHIYLVSGNNKLALDYYFKALKKIDDSRIKFAPQSLDNIRVYLYSSIAVCYFYLNLVPYATDFMNKSFREIEAANRRNPGTISEKLILKLMYNVGSLQLEAKKSDSAMAYMEKVLTMSKKSNDSTIMAAALANIGIIFLDKRMYEKAYPYLMQSYEIRSKMSDNFGIASAGNNLAKYYSEKGDYTTSISYFKQSLDASRKSNSVRSYKIAIKGLVNAYTELKDFTNLVKNQNILDSLNSTVFNTEITREVTDLARQYEFDLKFKLADLEHKKDLKAKQVKILIFVLLSAFFLLLSIVIFLLFKNQRNKTYNEQLKLAQMDLESKNLILEKEHLQLNLDYKNRELATNVMYLMQKNELVSDVVKRLKGIKDVLPENSKAQFRFIVNDLQQSADSTGWKEFELRFQEVHQEFYTNLFEKYPNLTPNEKKLASFLRMNMTSKDISALTTQSVESIKIARTRLRKKLGLQQDANLITFLESI